VAKSCTEALVGPEHRYTPIQEEDGAVVAETLIESSEENVVFIKLRHFSDFETYSHILQVQFFPSKIQF
jgi:hypothetical protein